MSNVGTSTNDPTDPVTAASAEVPVDDKGKGKIKPENAMEEDDEDDEDDEDEDEEEEVEEAEDDDEMDEDDEFDAIDAGAILPQGRRTRGVKVDYSSAEALKKAGLENGEVEGDDEEEFVAKDVVDIAD